MRPTAYDLYFKFTLMQQEKHRQLQSNAIKTAKDGTECTLRIIDTVQ